MSWYDSYLLVSLCKVSDQIRNDQLRNARPDLSIAFVFHHRSIPLTRNSGGMTFPRFFVTQHVPRSNMTVHFSNNTIIHQTLCSQGLRSQAGNLQVTIVLGRISHEMISSNWLETKNAHCIQLCRRNNGITRRQSSGSNVHSLSDQLFSGGYEENIIFLASSER